ncbi:unnamed protein product [Caenorhabditis sp. 36 PRJEB53466]|nr:unnamed protein product [Caenorhabditis sp. 36 PRJEB53466]
MPHSSSGRSARAFQLPVLKFLTHYPLCGSTLLLLIKRNSEERHVSDIIYKLTSRNIIVNVIESDEPSGGASSRSLYELSTKSNGFYIFNQDSQISGSVNETMTNLFGYNLWYSVNVTVVGKGGMRLPQAFFPQNKPTVTVNVGISLQNHPLTTDFHNYELTLTSPAGARYMSYRGVAAFGNADYASFEMYSAATWDVTLSYDYALNSTGVIQIRMYLDD